MMVLLWVVALRDVVLSSCVVGLCVSSVTVCSGVRRARYVHDGFVCMNFMMTLSYETANANAFTGAV